MSTRAAVGFSRHRNPRTAGAEAARVACAGLGGGRPDAVLVFATASDDAGALLAAVREQAPGAMLSGCSGEGVIAGPVSDEGEHGVGVLALHSDAIDFVALSVERYSTDPRAAGEQLAQHVRERARGDEFGLLLFPDGLKGNCGELLQALDASLPAGIQVAGGTAGDSLAFQRTQQYHDARVLEDSVSALLLRGRGRLELAVSHGCVPIGLERRVTRGEGGWMHEIDGRPAWSVFREYLDGEPEDLNTEAAIHLSMGEALPATVSKDYEPYLIRTPLGLDKSTGALYFPGGGIAEGSQIRLARRDPELIRDRARECAEKIARRAPDHAPAAVLQFDCAGRGKQLFGSRVSESIVTPLQEALGTQGAWLGFHTYGEIAPIGGQTRFHAFTVVLAALYENA